MKLSVIVPSYNVSNYLEDCIDSIVNQKIDLMEVLIVNDGSTDNTLEIAIRLEKKYEQVRVIDQPNGGLGNARNTGMKQAIGEYITFVDSDDIISDNAYKKMLSIIEESGSDFIIGNVVRFNSTRTYPSVLHQKVFFEDLIGVNIQKNAELIYDTTAWNKIFRMSFWKKFNFEFPEKMLYEDIPVTIPAHSVAQRVDVLTDIIYKWRARDAGDNSITQQKEKIENFVDRVKGIDMVKDFFNKYNVSNDLKESFDFKNLSMDFPLYLTYMLDVDEEYQKVVSTYIRQYLETVNQSCFSELSVLSRLKYRLIQFNKFNDFLELLKAEKQKKLNLVPVKTKEGLTFEYPFIEILTKNEKIGNIEFEPVTWIEEMVWQNNQLKLTGVAYLNRLNTNFRNKSQCKIYLFNERTKEQILITDKYNFKYRPEVTLRRGIDVASKRPFKRLFNYNYSGYEVIISEKIINQLLPTDHYLIRMELSNSGITKFFDIKFPQKGFRTKPNQIKIDNFIVTSNYNAAWEVYIKKHSNDNYISSINFSEDSITIKGKSISKSDRLIVHSVRNQKDFELIVEKKNNKFIAQLPASFYKEILLKSSQDNIDEILKFRFLDTEFLTFNNNDDIKIYGIGEFDQVTIKTSSDGLCKVRLGETLPVVTEMTKNKNSFNFQFVVPNTFLNNEVRTKLIMKGSNDIVELDYKLDFKNEHMSYLSASVPYSINLNEKIYAFYLSREVEEEIYSKFVVLDETSDSDLQGVKEVRSDRIAQINKKERTHEYLAPICLFNIGLDKIINKHKGIKFELYHPFGRNHLQYRVSSYWEKIDDGPRRQEVVRRILYPLWRKLSIKNNFCVLESFWGREFSDNPKAVYDYLNTAKPNMRYIIPLQDTLTEINYNQKNTRIVKLNSWRYLYYLARSKYFFNNVNFPDYYRKRDQAIEVQTMHGTPLKRLGLDNPGEVPLDKVESFVQKCQRWDYLTVPSDYVGEIAKSAYQFSNELLKIGYPRNDSLFDFNSNIKQNLLDEYELPKNKKIILYAPTWRVKGKFSIPMDLAEMKEKIGQDYIIIIKLHHYMKMNFSLDGVEDFAFVFGKNSQISDFYKLADILITDYSSVMFDYAILKKPMLFFTYDYDNYKNSLRGMYFDFKEEAPGPLVDTTDGLITEINEIDLYADKYQKKIKAFEKKYIQYDNGNASQKLVEKVIK